jgi:hypothetical protein
MGYSSDVKEHGAFAEWRGAPGSPRRWAITTVLVGSYQEGEVNREFSYLQGSYAGPRLSAWMSEEVDLNRGWKERAEGAAVSMTSTFVNLRLRAGEIWTFIAGYDNRRRVRLCRDRVTPATRFDDRYRTGAWAGGEAAFGGRFRAGLEARTRGGDPGSAGAYTLSLGAGRIGGIGLGARSRSTRCTGDRVDGWLHAVSVGAAPGGRWHVEATGGIRDETDVAGPSLDRRLTWAALDVDVALGRRWLCGLALERSRGDDEATDQIYTTLSYRF